MNKSTLYNTLEAMSMQLKWLKGTNRPKGFYNEVIVFCTTKIGFIFLLNLEVDLFICTSFTRSDSLSYHLYQL